MVSQGRNVRHVIAPIVQFDHPPAATALSPPILSRKLLNLLSSPVERAVLAGVRRAFAQCTGPGPARRAPRNIREDGIRPDER